MSQLKEGQTPHQVLGLGREASIEDIKKAYRKCALANHPDKAGDTLVAKRNMQLINDAYEKLTTNSTGANASATDAKDTDGFDGAGPKRNRERSTKKQRPRRESNHQFDPEESEYFFGKGFESPFDDFNDYGFNFWGSDGNTENSSSVPKMHLPASKKGRRKAKDFRDHQAHESADRRDLEAEAERAERGDKARTPNLWETDSFWSVFVEAARPPVNERFDFYPDGDFDEVSGLQSWCGAKFLVVPGFNAVSRQLDRIHKVLGKLVGSLCAISRWLADVAEIDRQSHRFTLTKEALEAGVRTAAKHLKLVKVANALHLSGWESNAEAVICFMDEMIALRKYLKAIEGNLNDVLLDFTEISKARLNQSKLFGSERRSVLWAALSEFKESIERLEQHRGARFVFSEYAGR